MQEYYYTVSNRHQPK